MSCMIDMSDKYADKTERKVFKELIFFKISIANYHNICFQIRLTGEL